MDKELSRKEGMQRLYRHFCVLMCLTLLWLLFPVAWAFGASNTDNADYIGTVRISNTGTAATNVFTTFSLNTTAMINANLCSDNVQNTALLTNAGADIEYMPARSDNLTWCVYVPSIGANDNLDYKLYTGGDTDMGGDIRYFPGDDGMTTSDSASLELGDNFTLELKGYLETSYTVNSTANQTLVYKENAFYVGKTQSGNVTAGVDVSDNVTPTAHDDIDSEWGNETNAYDDDTGTEATDAGGSYGTIELQYPAEVLCNGIRIFANAKTGTLSANITVYYDDQWITVFDDETISEDAWVTKYFSTGFHKVSAARIKLVSSAGDNCELNEFDFIGTTTHVIATGVSSGEATVKVDTAGNITGGLDFDGSSGDVTVADDASIQNIFDGGGTIECWINADGGGEADDGRIIDKRGTGWWLKVGGESGGKVKVNFFHDFDNSDGEWLSSSQEIDIDTWTHVVATYDNSDVANDPTIYVNGSSVSLTESATPLGTRSSDAGNDLYIGNNSGDSRTFDGTIDEVRLYKRILGQSEVTANYNSGVGQKDLYSSTNLTGHWRFDEGSGTTTVDETANSNDGTITSATWTQGHIPSQFAIYIDDAQQDGTRDDSVPDNSKDYTFLENGVMPYMEYQKIWVDGTLQQHIVWENADTFSDSSGNSHDATPTFRISTSDSDVSAELVDFDAITLSEADDYTTGTAGTMVGNVTAPSGQFTEVGATTNSTIPGVQILLSAADSAGFPRQMVVFPIVLIIVCAAGLVIGRYSLLAQWAVMGVVIFIAAGTLMAPAVGILFMLDGFAIVLAANQMGVS